MGLLLPHRIAQKLCLSARIRIGMRQSQDISVRPSITLAVLHKLIGQFLVVFTGIKARYSTAQPTAPSTHVLYILTEGKDVRRGPRNNRDSFVCRISCRP